MLERSETPVVQLELPVPPITEDKSLMTEEAPKTPPTETRELGINTDVILTAEKIIETTTPETKNIQTEVIHKTEISTITDQPDPSPDRSFEISPQKIPQANPLDISTSQISAASSQRRQRPRKLRELKIEEHEPFLGANTLKNEITEPKSANKSYEKSMTGLESLGDPDFSTEAFELGAQAFSGFGRSET